MLVLLLLLPITFDNIDFLITVETDIKAQLNPLKLQFLIATFA